MKAIKADIFDLSSLDNLITQLNVYKGNLETDLGDSMEILGKQATEFCKPYFINYDKHEEDEAELGVEFQRYDKPGFSITAKGKGVAFLEFGAGLTADYGHPFEPEAKKLGIVVGQWEWSKRHGTGFGFKHHFWYWGGRKWYYKPGQRFSRGLYNTSKWIQENAHEVIKRSWKK